MITPKRFDLRELYCKVLIRNVRIAEDERKFKTQPALKKSQRVVFFGNKQKVPWLPRNAMPSKHLSTMKMRG